MLDQPQPETRPQSPDHRAAAAPRRPDLDAVRRQLLARRAGASAVERVPGVPRREAAGDVALSAGQRQLWLADQWLSGPGRYHLPMVWQLRGVLDTAALEGALTRVVARHEALRTTFPLVDGEPVQRISRTADLPLARTDLSALPSDRRAQRLRDLLAAETTAPFDLAAAPAVRARLVRCADQEHVLVVTLHHIVTDGWSMGVLCEELSACYGAAAEGREPALPEVPVQYADWSQWQHGRLAQPWAAEALAHWRTALAGLDPLQLPAQRSASAGEPARAALLPVTLPADLVAPLQALARTEGTTLFTVLLTAYQALLSRLSGRHDIAVGTPMGNREQPELARTMGYLVNTLLLRTDCSGDPTFRELLRRTRATALGAYTHKELPFEKVLEGIGGAGDRPPVQAWFNLLQQAPRPPRLTGLEVTELEVHQGAATADLAVNLWPTGQDGLAGYLEYDTERFDEAAAGRLAGQFAALLRHAAEDADCALGRLRLLAPAERAAVLALGEGPACPGPAPLFTDVFRSRVAATPDALALVTPSDRYTFRELDTLADRTADTLRRAGVRPGTAVGVCAGRTAAQVVALLAALRIGATYLPLDPEYPVDRLAHMIGDSGAQVVATAAGGSVPGFTGRIIELDLTGGTASSAVPDRAPREAGPDDPAYLIYTSGSTGRPKGVLVTQRALAAHLARLQQRTPLTPADRVLQFSSFCFDASLDQILAPLAAGASVVLRDAPWGPEELLEQVARHQVTLVNVPPAYWHGLLRTVEDGSAALPPSVRRVVLGGDTLAPADVRLTQRLMPGLELINIYGPTEATVDSTLYEVPQGWAGERVPIGRPLPGTRVRILSEGMEPQPVGAVGELYIGGTALAAGYHGLPDRTGEAFVEDPFGTGPEELLYRTGDLGRWHPDGTVDLLGRRDAQLKIRGFRIEPGEIETALRALPGVREALVAVHGDTPAEQRLVGYVVADGAPPATGALRDGLRATLPSYLVPTQFVLLDALPVGVNGKLDRRTLPVPAERAAGERAPEGSRTPAEERMTRLWETVLRTSGIAVDEDFFGLGGTSITAMRLVSAVNREFGTHLAVRAVFEAPTIAELARRVGAPAEAAVAAVSRRPAAGDAPLSAGQRQMWLADQWLTGPGRYQLPMVWRLRGPLDPAALDRALAHLAARHEVLRTSFPLVDGEPVQRIDPTARISLTRTDLGSLPPDERTARMRDLLEAETTAPFDLAAAPPLRALLIRCAADEHVLALTMHHIITDGWSMGLFCEELSACYRAEAQGRRPDLPDAPLHYADWSQWQHHRLTQPWAAEALAYWRTTLTGLGPLNLPAPAGADPVPSARGALHEFTIEPRLRAALEPRLRESGTTPFMFLLAAYQILLGRLCGQHDIAVGTSAANREQPELARVQGFFANTLLLRTDCSGDPTFRELLRRTRATALGAYAHQELPFEKVIEEVRDPAWGAGGPPVQAWFGYTDAPALPLQLPGTETEALGVDDLPARLPIRLDLADRDGQIEGLIHHQVDLVPATTAAALATDLSTLLGAVADDPDLRLSALHDLLGRAEAASRSRARAALGDRMSGSLAAVRRRRNQP